MIPYSWREGGGERRGEGEKEKIYE